MEKVLTAQKVAEAIEQAGWGKLPSGSHFRWFGKEFTEVVITMPYPLAFYVKANADGEIVGFKSIGEEDWVKKCQ